MLASHPLTAAFLIGSVVATGFLMAAEYRGGNGPWRTLKVVSKTTAALLFVVAGATLTFGASGVPVGVGVPLFAALALSALGDILLLPRGAGGFFLAGLVSFLSAHVAYVIALAFAGVHLGAALAMCVPFALVAAPILRWLLRHVSPRMKRPVLAYVTVISIMGAAAGGHLWAFRDGGATTAAVAALMFFCSDICVARERFVAPGFVNKLIGLPLYFGAQWVWVIWLAVAFGVECRG